MLALLHIPRFDEAERPDRMVVGISRFHAVVVVV
jgi:hypothetical protein